jgi:hypothetical protein
MSADKTITFEGMINDAYTMASGRLRIIVLASEYFADSAAELIKVMHDDIAVLMYTHNGDDIEHIEVSGIVSKVKTARKGGIEFVFNLDDGEKYFAEFANYKLLDTLLSFSVIKEKKNDGMVEGRVRKSSRKAAEGPDSGRSFSKTYVRRDNGRRQEGRS